MPRKYATILFIILLPLNTSAQNRMFLSESTGVDINKLMEKNQIFVARIQDTDVDDMGNIYILDDRSGNVVRMDIKTGSLINRISSLGQGPAELMMPSVVRVRNKRVFILTGVHVKMFSPDGAYLGSFKTEHTPRWMDVDKESNIYIAEADRESNPVISVYNIHGKKNKTAVTFYQKREVLEDRGELFKRQFIKFKLDYQGNTIVLFALLRELKKIGPEGNLLWERKIENAILRPFLKNEKTDYDSEGRPTISYLISNLDVDQENNIIIGHVGGGCIYNQSGSLISILEVRTLEPRDIPPGLTRLKIIGDKLLGIYTDGTTILFPFGINKSGY